MLPIRPLASSLCLLALLALPGLAPAEGNGADFLRSNPRFLSAFRKIVAGVSPSVVRIRCDERDTALGFVVGADGWILTKAHDLKGRITCRLGDERELEATLVGVSEQHDLALLRIAAQGLPPLALADSKAVQAGNWVVSVGMGRDPVAIGVVSVPTRDVAKGKAASAKAPYLGVALSSNEAGVHITEVLAGTAAARAGFRAATSSCKSTARRSANRTSSSRTLLAIGRATRSLCESSARAKKWTFGPPCKVGRALPGPTCKTAWAAS
jgi:serine protease Do